MSKMAMIQDITEFKEAEAARRQEEQNKKEAGP
jgi:hypothetical protein